MHSRLLSVLGLATWLCACSGGNTAGTDSGDVATSDVVSDQSTRDVVAIDGPGGSDVGSDVGSDALPDAIPSADGITQDAGVTDSGEASTSDAPTSDAPTTGCTDSLECGSGSFCAHPAGTCSGTGSCMPRPSNCPFLCDQVCGCDGMTYCNSCIAAAAGVSIASAGACGTSDAATDAPTTGCTDNTQCSAAEYCAHPSGTCSASGTCTTRPTNCPLFCTSTCGCDGHTYCNACIAASAGVSIASSGACADAGSDAATDAPVGGCTDNLECSAGQYCAHPTGMCSALGTCTTVPTLCPNICSAVCGCNGTTYCNSCFAARGGTSIAYSGACSGGGSDAAVDAPTFGCTDNTQCAANQYCARPSSMCTAVGTCTARPTFCPQLCSLVCGCNGMTFCNACFAAEAGTSVAGTGSCTLAAGG